MKTNRPALRHGILILAGMALAASPAISQTQEPAGATATASVISSVAITQAPQRSAVRVEGEGRLDVHASRMQSPDRLVLDFSGTRLAVQKTAIEGVSSPVRGVRLGQFRPDVARVVIDLTVAAPYQISRDGSAVVVYFDAQPGSPADATLSPATLTAQDHKSRANFAYTVASVKTPVSRTHGSKNLQISAPRFVLPGELTQPSASLASFSAKNEPARPDGSVQQAVQQANTAASTVASSGQQMSPTPAAAGKYTGEPISVNLKDVDLRDFFT